MHRFNHEAMATTFEIVVADQTDEAYARSAATAVFADIDRLESDLSRFRPDSDLARIRSLPADSPLHVSLATLDCLALSKDVATATKGAFDVAIAAVWEAWRAPDGSIRTPSPEELKPAGFSVRGSHIIDPRTRCPAPLTEAKDHVWACAPSAALADALSTAFIVMSREEIDAFCAAHPDIEAILPERPKTR